MDKGTEGPNQVTHWNQKESRGKRLDRVYVNFTTEMKIVVGTFYHPWTDHKGVEYTLSSVSDH